MSATLQVIYPASDDTTFDYDYYRATHLPLVGEYMGEHLEGTLITKGLPSAADAPAAYYAIATLVFKSAEAMNTALAGAGPVIEDIANFTNTQPQMVVGEIMS